MAVKYSTLQKTASESGGNLVVTQENSTIMETNESNDGDDGQGPGKLQRRAYVIAFIDLILANFALCLGKNSFSYPDSKLRKWDLLSYYVQFGKSEHFSPEILSMTLICLIYVSEASLFILLATGARELRICKLRLWYHIKFFLYVLTSTMIVLHIAALKGTLKVFIAQSLLGFIILLYRGYCLLIITLLEEYILQHVQNHRIFCP